MFYLIGTQSLQLHIRTLTTLGTSFYGSKLVLLFNFLKAFFKKLYDNQLLIIYPV